MIFTNNIDPIFLTLGPLSIRWYGLFFALGIVVSFFVVNWAFKREKYPLQDLESVALYLFVGLVVGARLGHVFFYNAEYFLSNPAEILMIWKGGLASHGAAIGLLVSYWVWTLVHKVKFSKYTDVLILSIPIVAAFVRLGNYFNSEIVGRPTMKESGVIFERLGEAFPRYPSQLYESGIALVLVFVMLWVYKKFYKKTPPMFMMFLLMLLYFLTRFIVEFWKDRHIMPIDFPLSMGQMLSIVPVLIAMVYFIFFYPRQKKRG